MDDVVGLAEPDPLHAVGLHCEDFRQVSDAKVFDLRARANSAALGSCLHCHGPFVTGRQPGGRTGLSIAVSAPVATAVACCLVPIATVITCTLWSMTAGLIDVCMPLTDGCTSISRACRQVPVIYLFRATMLPISLLMVLFWWQEKARLATLAPDRTILRGIAFAAALVGASFLVLYVVFLGTDGALYGFLRRIGIYFFFAGTALAQLLVTAATDRGVRKGAARGAHLARRVLVAAMLALGPVNLVLNATLAEPDRAQNIIEWWFGLAMFTWFGVTGIERSRTAAVVA